MVKPRAPVVAVPWWLSGGIAASNCIGAWQAKGATSLADSYVNLANPGTYNAYPYNNAPGWTADNGWTMERLANQALATGIIVGVGWSAIGRFSDVNPTTGTALHGLFGGRNATGTQRFFVHPWRSFSGSVDHAYGYGAQFIVPVQYTSGVIALCAGKGYMNGVFDYSTGGTYAGGATFSIGVEGYNFGANPFGGKIQAVAVYSTELSAAQVAAISTAMAAL